MLALVLNLVTNLRKLGHYPWVVNIAMGVQFGEIAVTFVSAAVSNEPAG